MSRGVKRDHENGICPMTNKEFNLPESDDFVCWSALTCSECGEQIGARSCELRNNFTHNCDKGHKLGVCPVTRKQFTFPMSDDWNEFVCSECDKVIDYV